jgi:hypothetical protein
MFNARQLLGLELSAQRICISSGGWASIIEKFERQKLIVTVRSKSDTRGKKEIEPIKGECGLTCSATLPKWG